MRCKNHDYMYYNASWRDEVTGVEYKKGYYDEDGRYYDADSIAFKKPDGSYEAHYECDFCGTELEANWKEGFYPTCKNCGAEMQKTPVYVDEFVNIQGAVQDGQISGSWVKPLILIIVTTMFVPMIAMILFAFILVKMQSGEYSDSYSESVTTTYVEEQQESNLDILVNREFSKGGFLLPRYFFCKNF